ncbi:sorbin and sh3 domain-containing protein 2 [Plakobranchus ocellatus]|uniref:Sorbin and sh3 domain-containing protein 2 n=1 Tax=Plakobranchus ocellatus TaxID=259542 RepID=A0AAV4BWQ7_9GAST|nr:sorbin and sh3 domain-containing protein 2 [Plakobranchus ocellatus]
MLQYPCCLCVVPTDHRQPIQWAEQPRQSINHPASHAHGRDQAFRPRPPETSPILRSRVPTSPPSCVTPPPLPLAPSHPHLRHVPPDTSTPLQSNIHYKPYPDQPPSPTSDVTLSPRLKHKLVLSPPSRRKQQPPQRQIVQQVQYRSQDTHLIQQQQLIDRKRQQEEATLLQKKEERFHSQQQQQNAKPALFVQPIEIQKHYTGSYSSKKQQQQQQQQHHQQQQQKLKQQHQPHFQLDQQHSNLSQPYSLESSAPQKLSYFSIEEPFHPSQQHPQTPDKRFYHSAPQSPEMSRALTLPRPQNLQASNKAPENFPYQLMTPPGHSQPLPMKDFIEQMQEELVSPKETMSIKQQYEEFERKRKLEGEPEFRSNREQENAASQHFFTLQRPSQRSTFRAHEISNLPSYPPPQEPRTHHRRPPPPAPLNLRSPPVPRAGGDPFSPTSNPFSPPSYISRAGFFSPPASSYRGPSNDPHISRAMFFSPPPTSSSQRLFSPPPADPNRPRGPPSKVYRPTAMSEMLIRGSPTPSLPADVLRRRQDISPTPSEKSTLSEQVPGGVAWARGRKSRGLNLFLKQQNRLAALDADAQDDDARQQNAGHPVYGQPFQPQSRTYDDAALPGNGRVGSVTGDDSLGRGYYTVGRPSNLKFLSRSRSLQASPTVPAAYQGFYQEGREGQQVLRQVSDSSPRRIPITVKHEPPSQPVQGGQDQNHLDPGEIRQASEEIRNQFGLQSPSKQEQRQREQHYASSQNADHQWQHRQNSQPTQPWQASANRNIPINSRRSRRYSEEESSSSRQHPAEGSSKLSSSWQSPGTLQYGPRGPGSYATLPSKGSQQRTRQQQQHQQQEQGPQQEQEPQQTFFDRSATFSRPSDPIPVPTDTYATLPTIKPLKSSSTLGSLNLSDSHRAGDSRSGLSSSFPGRGNGPGFKSSQSSFEFGDRRDLEHTLDDSYTRKDFSRPLWANTDLDRKYSQRSSVSSSQGEDGHSPHSDNAVSSSDSRDTIIAKEEKCLQEILPHPRSFVNSSEPPAVQMYPYPEGSDHSQRSQAFSSSQNYRGDVYPRQYLNSHQPPIDEMRSPEHHPRRHGAGESQPQSRLGPPTSPKPGRRIPITVVHERSAPAHVTPGVRELDNQFIVRCGQNLTPIFYHRETSVYPASPYKPSDYRPNGPSSDDLYGLSHVPSKPADNWGSQTLPARSKVEGREAKPFPPETSLRNIAPVWKPSGGGVGSLTIKKEYKPVRLDTSKKPVQREEQRTQPEQSLDDPHSTWRPPPRGAPVDSPAPPSSSYPTFPSLPPPLDTSNDSVFSASSGPSAPPPALSNSSTSSSLWATATDQTDFSDSTLVSSSVHAGRHTHMNGESGGGQSEAGAATGADDSRLPPTQSPYITLLQKSRDPEDSEDNISNLKFVHKPIMVKDDGQLPRGATYIGSQHKMEGDRSVTEDYYTSTAPPDTSAASSSRLVEQKPVKYEGIGPLNKEGVPLANRKNVTEENQHQWYKQMYKSLHRTDKKEAAAEQLDASSDVIYYDLMPEEKNTYKPTYTFPDDISDTKSEEGLDVGSYRPSYGKSKSKVDDSGYRSEPEGRHKDVMKFRSKSTSSSDGKDGRRKWNPPNVRSKIEVYRCQPRSIMDYEPGFSSIAFREAKSPHNPRIDKPGDFSQ